MKAQVYQLHTAGFTVVPGVLGAGLADDLAARMDQMLAEDDVRWGADRLIALGQRGALRNLADRGEVFEGLLGLPVLHDIAAALVGVEYRLHSYDGLVLGPGEGRYPWDFHTDLLDLCGVAFPAISTPGVNFLVAVDDSGPDNGATWIVPGSHRSVVRAPAPELLAGLAVQPQLSRGDLLAFDVRIWHCAGDNHSGLSRRLIKIEMVQPWIRPQLDYARAIRPEVFARLDPAAKHAIGVPPPADVTELLGRLALRNRSDRSDRSDRGDRGGYGGYGDRSDRGDRGDHGDRLQRVGRPAGPERL